MAAEYTQALLAANGSIFDIEYFNDGDFLMMVGKYSAPSTNSSYFDPGMVEISMFTVTDGDGSTFTTTALANGMLRCLFSGNTSVSNTGLIFVWGR